MVTLPAAVDIDSDAEPDIVSQAQSDVGHTEQLTPYIAAALAKDCQQEQYKQPEVGLEAGLVASVSMILSGTVGSSPALL